MIPLVCIIVSKLFGLIKPDSKTVAGRGSGVRGMR